MRSRGLRLVWFTGKDNHVHIRHYNAKCTHHQTFFLPVGMPIDEKPLTAVEEELEVSSLLPILAWPNCRCFQTEVQLHTREIDYFNIVL